MFLKQNISASFIKEKLEKLRSHSYYDDLSERKTIKIPKSPILENSETRRPSERSKSLHFDLSKNTSLEPLNEKISPKKFKNEPSNKNNRKLIPTLRGELLCFPSDLKNLNASFNSSFVSFNDIHKKSPDLYPILNYIPKKELDEFEEKRKKEENLTAIDKFFSELRRGSTKKNVSNEILFTYRDATQIRKEIYHNKNQKKLYEDFVKIEGNELNDEIYKEYKHKNKK